MEEKKDNAIRLFPKQGKVFNALMDNSVNGANTIVYGGSARSGKSVVGSLWLLNQGLTHPNSKWLIGRRELGELKATTIDTFKRIVRQGNMMDYFLIGDKGDIVNNSTNQILFKNGSIIYLKDLDVGGDLEMHGLGGYELTGFWIDEAQECERTAYAKLIERSSFGHTQFGTKPKAFLTCNPTQNWIKREFYDADKKGTLTKDVKFFQAYMEENKKNLPKEYLDNMTLEKLGTKRYNEMVLGLWEYVEGADTLFVSSDVYDCFTNNKDGLPRGEKMISVDPAGQGKDSTCIVYADGWFVSEIIKMEKADTPTVVARVNELRMKHNVPSRNIIVDCGGMAGHADYLRHSVRYHSNGKVLDGQNFNMLRSQLIYKLSDAIRKRQIRFSPFLLEHYQEELAQQATEHRAVYQDKDTKQGVTSKDVVKKRLTKWSSPDLFDAVYMLMYFTFKPKFQPSQCIEF